MLDGRQHDVLLQGARVIDPANGLDGIADVLISDGKIAQVGPNLDVTPATKVIDLSGKIVTPGIIDIHVHNVLLNALIR